MSFLPFKVLNLLGSLVVLLDQRFYPVCSDHKSTVLHFEIGGLPALDSSSLVHLYDLLGQLAVLALEVVNLVSKVAAN